MSDSIHNATLFLVNTFFDLYLFVLVIRLLLVWVGANYFDSITQFIVRLTDFIIKPMRRLIPNIGRIETATIVLILALEIIRYCILSMLTFGMPHIIGLLLMSAADFIKIIIQVFFYAILFQALLSWIQPMSPANRTLSQLSAPIMQPLRRIIPPIGGMDLTPIPALIILQLLLMIIVNPLMAAGLRAAVG